MPTTSFWTNGRGQVCIRVYKSYEPLSGQHTGKQARKRLQQNFAAKCGGVYSSCGEWFLHRNDGKPDEKIWVTGFPDEDIMDWVINYADENGQNYVIPSEELDEVFRAAAAATSPEGRRLAEQERQRLEQERREREAQEKEAMRLRQEERLKELIARNALLLKEEYAEEEAWWLENSSGRMDFLGF
jgi:hypothetical protein